MKYFGTDLTKYVQEFYSKIIILYTCNLYNIVEQLQRSPGEGNGNLLQYSCLENPMVGEVWQATVHGVTELDKIERLTLSHSSFTSVFKKIYY